MGYKDLIVWQKSKKLAVNIYKFTDYLPLKAKYSLVDQMRRAAISIPSNIAEGHERASTRDFIRFLSISNGSLAELITQLEITFELYPELKDLILNLLNKCEEVSRMLNRLIRKLKMKKLSKKTNL